MEAIFLSMAAVAAAAAPAGGEEKAAAGGGEGEAESTKLVTATSPESPPLTVSNRLIRGATRTEGLSRLRHYPGTTPPPPPPLCDRRSPAT